MALDEPTSILVTAFRPQHNLDERPLAFDISC